MKLNIKLKPVSILEYLLMLIIFVNGQSVFIRYLPSKFITAAWAAIAVTLLILLFDYRLAKKDLLSVILFEVFFMVYLLATRKSSYYNQYVVRICIVFPLFFLLCRSLWKKGTIKKFILKFSDIVCLFALASVILYVLGTILHVVPGQTATYEWAKVMKTSTHYFYLMFEAQTTEMFGMTLIRNCGIFCEAPSYAVPLIIGLFLETFLRDNMSKKRVVILLITIVTSWSTKAISIALVVIALKMYADIYFSKNRPSGVVQLMKLIMPVLLVFVASIALNIVGDKIDTASGFMRLDNIYTGWKAFMANPFFGVGFENETELNRYASYMTSSGGLAMGIPVLLGEGGLYLFSFYLYGMLLFIKRAENHFTAFSFVIVHILVLFTSNIPYFLSTVLILALEYSTPLKRKAVTENDRKEV